MWRATRTNLALSALCTLSLAACQATFTGGLVPTDDAAVVIAERVCAAIIKHYPSAWHAVLDGDTWIVWKQQGVPKVTINAATAESSGCVTPS